MKKIAIFVEGQTEQFFINKLLIEIAGKKNILIELKKFSGKKTSPKRDIYPKTFATPTNPKHSVLIYDCGGDDSVKSRIIEENQDLQNDGYLEIIGLRDLYPLNDLTK
jgi:predicted ATP-dependent endonuclease of OLD family